ncbi:hypothetical protein OOZ54_12550 [Rhodopseudomonas palustris]|uniref:hypothetical protein n=1 Tax=Rhodopseudomonas palustris TaxID=1076 RepID=UPI0022F13394|nr:hypothetical protein [Rhodopseudomonas palustris]WBU27524.1 hypothetical protein OOZ54_12550 [Rhodopseudomonas palustris]
MHFAQVEAARMYDTIELLVLTFVLLFALVTLILKRPWRCKEHDVVLVQSDVDDQTKVL